MRSHLSIVSLTLLCIDFTASNHDRDTTRKHTGNPWQTVYSESEQPPDKSDLEYDEPWKESGNSHSVSYPSAVVGHDHDLYDQNMDNSYLGQSEHVHRHRTRHIHSNSRGAYEHVQETVSPSAVVLEQSTGDSLVTMDPDELDRSNCTFCEVREANKKYRIEQIQKEILAKLRIERPPNITDTRLPQIPEISEWLRRFDGSNPDTPHQPIGPDEPKVSIMSMLNLAKPPPKNKVLPNMENVCYFELHPDVEPSDIVRATLGVFVRPVERETNIETMFLIYKVKPRRRGNPMIRRKRIFLNHRNTNKWHRFNVETVVKSWVRNSDNNYGLQIMVYDDQGESLAIVEPNNSTEELFKPYIEVEIRERSNSRERRMIGLDCHEEDSETRCCRYPLIVDFESYGWDWIIQPKRYPAYYCAGECTFAFLSSAYGHLLQQSSKGTGPCCTPRKMSSISMLYYDENYNIVYGTLPGMVVDRCGCT